MSKTKPQFPHKLAPTRTAGIPERLRVCFTESGPRSHWEPRKTSGNLDQRLAVARDRSSRGKLENSQEILSRGRQPPKCALPVHDTSLHAVVGAFSTKNQRKIVRQPPSAMHKTIFSIFPVVQIAAEFERTDSSGRDGRKLVGRRPSLLHSRWPADNKRSSERDGQMDAVKFSLAAAVGKRVLSRSCARGVGPGQGLSSRSRCRMQAYVPSVGGPVHLEWNTRGMRLRNVCDLHVQMRGCVG